MAAGAVRSPAALMRIITSMTGNAGAPQALPALTNMARHTGRGPVRTRQRKAGLGMIKALHRFPSRCHMAALAGAAQLSAMRILSRMASGAIACQSLVVISCPMTGGAGHTLVGAGQGIVRERMVEIGPIQPNQSKTTPFMITVAGFTRAGARGRKFAVIPLSSGDIRPDGLMAGNAFSVLRGFLERAMASAAIGLQLGMGTSQRPRRNQPFYNALCKNGGRQQRQKQQDKAQRFAHQYICTATMCKMTAATIRMNKGICSKCQSRSNRS